MITIIRQIGSYDVYLIEKSTFGIAFMLLCFIYFVYTKKSA